MVLRAILELARQHGKGPLSIAAIGTAEDIPPQFLQVIMRELRQEVLLKVGAAKTVAIC